MNKSEVLNRMIDNLTTPKKFYHNKALNVLSLSVNRVFIRELNLRNIEIKVLMEMLFRINRENIVSKKEIKSFVHRTTLSNVLKRLQAIGIVYDKMDGNILINPKIACMQRSRKDFDNLQKIWYGFSKINI